uniref:Vomeronasal type-1 receptor n=1 Tax=Erpetoichthys calabaricus TaxID=27687 RepID=A0A8C4XD23_ERPCA
MNRSCVMDNGPAVKAAGFLTLIIISIPANLAVVGAFLYSFLTEGKPMTTDIILCHLTFVNLMVAFVRSIPQTLTALGYQNLFDDIGCKISIFSFRIFRSLSISLTCLLSTYQAVLLAPMSSMFSILKYKIPQYLLQIFFCFYMFSSATSVHPILYAVSKLVNNTIPPYTFNLDYCFVKYSDYSSYVGIGLSNFLKDLVFIILMTITSVYILVLLYLHSKRVKNIRIQDKTIQERNDQKFVTQCLLAFSGRMTRDELYFRVTGSSSASLRFFKQNYTGCRRSDLLRLATRVHCCFTTALIRISGA